jgi:hypothetical protein
MSVAEQRLLLVRAFLLLALCCSSSVGSLRSEKPRRNPAFGDQHLIPSIFILAYVGCRTKIQQSSSIDIYAAGTHFWECSIQASAHDVGLPGNKSSVGQTAASPHINRTGQSMIKWGSLIHGYISRAVSAESSE